MLPFLFVNLILVNRCLHLLLAGNKGGTMLTNAIKEHIKFNPMPIVQAIREIKLAKIQSIATKLSISPEDADRKYRLDVYNSAIDAEINVRDFLNTIIPKSAKRPRNSPQKEKLKIPLIAKRVGDVVFTVDTRKIIVESKQRSYPGTLYDSIVDKKSKTYLQSLHIVDGADTVWYVLTEHDLKLLIADKVPPKLLQRKYQGMKQYDDMFKTTKYKTKYIDILCLTQKQFPLIFFVRPRTYGLLLSRCTGNVIANDSQSMENAVELLKFCQENYKHNLSRRLDTSFIELDEIVHGRTMIDTHTYKKLTKLYCELKLPKRKQRKPKKPKKSAKM